MTEEEARMKEDNEYIKCYQEAYMHAEKCGLEERFAKSYAKTKAEDPEAIKHVKTTQGTLEYFIDWEVTEGSVVMLNPKTTSLYHELRYDTHPDVDEYGVFFAFNQEQFDKGYNHLVELGFISNGDKISMGNGGVYGTPESIKAFLDFYENRDKEIPTKCDPQEAYFFEYNNFESMIAWDGDKDAYNTIVNLWGEDVAKTIIRIY